MWRGIKLSKGKFRFYLKKKKNPNGNMLKEQLPEKCMGSLDAGENSKRK